MQRLAVLVIAAIACMSFAGGALALTTLTKEQVSAVCGPDMKPQEPGSTGCTKKCANKKDTCIYRCSDKTGNCSGQSLPAAGARSVPKLKKTPGTAPTTEKTAP
jgi:hypothetical protein